MATIPDVHRRSGATAEARRRGTGRATGYRRFIKIVDDSHFALDRNKADEDVRFDGVFVLRTNTDLNPLLAMLRYKSSGPSNRP